MILRLFPGYHKFAFGTLDDRLVARLECAFGLVLGIGSLLSTRVWLDHDYSAGSVRFGQFHKVLLDPLHVMKCDRVGSDLDDSR